MPYVYILEGEENGRYYIGSTLDIKKRICHHQGGHTPSTSKFGKLKIVFTQEYETLIEARNIERKLKKIKRKDYLFKIIESGIITIE